MFANFFTSLKSETVAKKKEREWKQSLRDNKNAIELYQDYTLYIVYFSIAAVLGIGSILLISRQFVSLIIILGVRTLIIEIGWYCHHKAT